MVVFKLGFEKLLIFELTESKEGLSKWKGILHQNAEASRHSPVPETASNLACQMCKDGWRGKVSHSCIVKI